MNVYNELLSWRGANLVALVLYVIPKYCLRKKRYSMESQYSYISNIIS